MDSPLVFQPRARVPLTTQRLQETLRTSIGVQPFQQDPAISKFLRDAENELILYEAFINQVRGRRAALELEIAEYTSLRAPIRRLPPELLLRIFTLLTSTWHCNTFGVTEVWRSSTLALAAVCFSWRRLVLDSSELWTCFGLNAAYTERARAPLNLFLERSGELPLVWYIESFKEEADSQKHSDDFLELLVDESYRWKAVEVNLEEPDMEMLEDVEETPILESIVLQPSFNTAFTEMIGKTAPLEHITNRDFVVTPDTKALRKLYRAEDVSLEVSPGRLPKLIESIPLYAAVTTLKLQGYCTHHADQRYSRFDHRPMDNPPEETEIVTSSTIRSLSVDTISTSTGVYHIFEDLFERLTLPSLSELRIIGDTWEEKNTIERSDWPRDTIDSFLSRSNCAVTSLSLVGMPLRPSDVLHILSRTPALQDLTLYEYRVDIGYRASSKYRIVRTVDDSVLRYLKSAVFEQDGLIFRRNVFLPKLERLRLRVNSHFDADQLFVDVVQSRWYHPDCVGRDQGVVAKLSTVELDIRSRSVDSKIYEPLRALDAAGMMITVRSSLGFVV